LILIGGGEKPIPVLQKFVQLAGGTNSPILIFPTASGEADTGSYYQKLFREKLNCRNIQVINIRNKEDASKMCHVKAILAAGGIFFSGGDQSKITAALLGTTSGTAIKHFFKRGGVLGGTSAGTACMSGLMLTGEGNKKVIEAKNITLVPGLGFFPNVIVDQHFVTRSRQNRLLSTVLEHPELLGVGIEESTAIWLKPNLEMTVLGEGWVFVYDARSAIITRRKVKKGNPHLGVKNMRLHILQPKDQFDIKTGTVL
jgi:cyanophycinase